MADWLEFRLEVAARDAELVADILQQQCPGGTAIDERHAPRPSDEWYDPALRRGVDGDRVIVRAFLPADHDAGGLRRSLHLALSFAPLSRRPRWLRSRRLREQDWQEGWKRYFRPLHIGQHLVVKPSWRRYTARRGDVVIELDPGMAFGTGQHPTTAMCLQAIERHLHPGERVLDIGTGSGILAIAAVLLGAASVLAIDNDPQAVKAAKANAAANSVSPLIQARETTLEKLSPIGEYAIVLANVSGLFVERLHSQLACALAPGGRLIVGGFLAETSESLASMLEGDGLRIAGRLEDGEWRVLVAEKPDA